MSSVSTEHCTSTTDRKGISEVNTRQHQPAENFHNFPIDTRILADEHPYMLISYSILCKYVHDETYKHSAHVAVFVFSTLKQSQIDLFPHISPYLNFTLTKNTLFVYSQLFRIIFPSWTFSRHHHQSRLYAFHVYLKTTERTNEQLTACC